MTYCFDLCLLGVSSLRDAPMETGFQGAGLGVRQVALAGVFQELPLQLDARRAHFLEAGGDDHHALHARLAALADQARHAAGRRADHGAAPRPSQRAGAL